MGFLDKIFRKGIDRSQWVEISNSITIMFENVRNIWFKQCIKDLQNATTDETPITIERHILADEGLIAAKAFQIFTATPAIAEKKYIPLSQVQDFTDILFAQICGSDLEEILKHIEQYVTDIDNIGDLRFCNEIAEFITGNDEPFIKTEVIKESLTFFMYYSNMVISSTFGDGSLLQSIKQMVAKENGKSILNNDILHFN